MKRIRKKLKKTFSFPSFFVQLYGDLSVSQIVCCMLQKLYHFHLLSSFWNMLVHLLIVVTTYKQNSCLTICLFRHTASNLLKSPSFDAPHQKSTLLAIPAAYLYAFSKLARIKCFIMLLECWMSVAFSWLLCILNDNHLNFLQCNPTVSLFLFLFLFLEGWGVCCRMFSWLY